MQHSNRRGYGGILSPSCFNHLPFISSLTKGTRLSALHGAIWLCIQAPPIALASLHGQCFIGEQRMPDRDMVAFSLVWPSSTSTAFALLLPELFAFLFARLSCDRHELCSIVLEIPQSCLDHNPAKPPASFSSYASMPLEISTRMGRGNYACIAALQC